MKRLHRALLRRSFDYMRWHRYRRYQRGIDPAREPLIIYQMGKVGSSTVYDTLEQQCPQFQVFQVHVLTGDWIREVQAQYRAASRDHGRPMLDEHVLASRYLATRIRRERGRRWKVVTLVRDPVARNVSTFFEAFDVYFSSAAAANGGIAGEHAESLRRRFLEEFGECHRVPLVWFETHMAPVFGVDVYREPFDTDAGYQILRGDDCDLLILRTEDLRAAMRPAMQRFLGVEVPELRSSNVSADKSYADQFAQFKRGLELPDTYLDEMYGSRFARHFYTADELAAFRERWSSS